MDESLVLVAGAIIVGWLSDLQRCSCLNCRRGGGMGRGNGGGVWESLSKFLHLHPEFILELHMCLLEFRPKRRGLGSDVSILEGSNAALKIIKLLFKMLSDLKDLIEREGKGLDGCGHGVIIRGRERNLRNRGEWGMGVLDGKGGGSRYRIFRMLRVDLSRRRSPA
jgi:hypothetical protein